MARPAGRNIAVAFFACALCGCAATRYNHDTLQRVRAHLLAAARTGTQASGNACALQNAEFQGEENLLSGMPFRLLLSCGGGRTETFVLSHPALVPAESGPRFISVAAADDGAEHDLARVSALVDQVFEGDPWVMPVATFNPGNAVERPWELVIIGFIVAALAGGLALVVVSRPEPGSQ